MTQKEPPEGPPAGPPPPPATTPARSAPDPADAPDDPSPPVDPAGPAGDPATTATEPRRRRGPASRVEARVAARAGRRAREVKRTETGTADTAPEAGGRNLPVVASNVAPPAEPEPALTPPPEEAARLPSGGARIERRRGAPRVAGQAKRAASPSRAAAAAAAAALDAPLVPEESEGDPFDLAAGIALRLAGLAWLVAAVFMWGRLVGYSDDVIDPAWHAPGGPWLTTLTASVVYPIVAVGLWLRGRWGVVLWASAVAAEVILALTAPSLLPFGMPALLANLAALAAVGGIAGAGYLRRPRERAA